MGFPRSGEAILEIAEAAEQAWLSARERLKIRLAGDRIPRLGPSRNDSYLSAGGKGDAPPTAHGGYDAPLDVLRPATAEQSHCREGRREKQQTARLRYGEGEIADKAQSCAAN